MLNGGVSGKAWVTGDAVLHLQALKNFYFSRRRRMDFETKHRTRVYIITQGKRSLKRSLTYRQIGRSNDHKRPADTGDLVQKPHPNIFYTYLHVDSARRTLLLFPPHILNNGKGRRDSSARVSSSVEGSQGRYREAREQYIRIPDP